MELAEYEVLLSDVEVKLDRLKVLYEQWFQGMERLEPTIPRKDMERRVLTLRKELPRNTALRFRFQQLVQRYTTLQTYWQRVGRQIEEGTYRRDLMKARKARIELRQHHGASIRPVDLDIDVDVMPTEEDRVAAFVPAHLRTPPPPVPVAPIPMPVVPPAPKAFSPFARRPVGSVVAPLPKPPSHPPAPVAPVAVARPPVVVAPPAPVVVAPKPASPAPGPTATFSRPKDAAARLPGAVPPEVEERRVYERYLEARRQNNETTSVAFETVSKSLREMRDRLKEKYAGKRVEFEVVVKDGKVGLKPVPK